MNTNQLLHQRSEQIRRLQEQLSSQSRLISERDRTITSLKQRNIDLEREKESIKYNSESYISQYNNNNQLESSQQIRGLNAQLNAAVDRNNLLSTELEKYRLAALKSDDSENINKQYQGLLVQYNQLNNLYNERERHLKSQKEENRESQSQ